MVYNFDWKPQPKSNVKANEAAATQYIKAKYGTSLEEFIKMIVKNRTPQNKQSVAEIDLKKMVAI